jgi:hypothetical protein
VGVIDLVIDELVLDGVAPEDPLVAAAIERAVGPALAEHGVGGAAARVGGVVVEAIEEHGS